MNVQSLRELTSKNLSRETRPWAFASLIYTTLYPYYP